MSYKGELEDVLTTLKKKYTDYCDRVNAIKTYVDLSDTGKENKILEERSKWADYWQRRSQQTMTRGEEIAANVNRQEAAALEKKISSGDYATLLANTLAVLPDAMADCNAQDLKARLAVFANDPFAIAAIRQVVNSSGRVARTHDGNSMMMLQGIIPEDHRGERAAAVSQITQTVCSHIQTVLDAAASWGYRASIIAGIDSTLAYIEHCNDDCTVYDEEAARKSQNPAPASFTGPFSFRD